ADVSECGELARFFGIDGGGRAGLRDERLDGRTHGYVRAAIAVDDVLLLAGIGGEVVQLRNRRANVLMLTIDQRMQIAPSEVEARVERFRVDAAGRRALVEHREE